MDSYQQLPTTDRDMFDETPPTACSVLLGVIVTVLLLALAFLLLARSLSRGLVV